MAWGNVDVEEQRMRFVIAVSRKEKPFNQLCAEFDISRPTGYEWWKRYQAGGHKAVVEKSRRPHHSPEHTAAKVEARIVELRRQFPDWGARKLQVVLQRQNLELPVITIHRILLRHGLVRVQDRHRQAVQRFERAAPNQLWQMDFKSPIGWGAPVGPLSLLDDHSRYVLALTGTWSTRAEPVRERLEQAFQDCGVPESMLMDHGTPWWNMKAERGWTWLTVWLMKQGIDLHFSGYRHPQTQGKVERFHGAMADALQHRGYPSFQQRQQWLDQFRQEYNHLRPHEALQMKTPGSVWRKSEQPYQAHPPAWEYGGGAELVRVASNGELRIQGRGWGISRALVGEWVQLIRIDQRILVYYCRTLVRELDFSERSPADANRSHWGGV
ncbi:MAG TPA: IS481 family transposase [Candidatus Angelobacter sp.]|nr:IS481 family transposase [Candidatus Angelobacter sp.]